MAAPPTWLIRSARLLLLLAGVVALIAISSGIAAYLVSRQMRSVLEGTAAMRERPSRPSGKTVSIDFYQASGIGRDELSAWLDSELGGDVSEGLPVVVTLQNGEGEYLADGAVRIQWESGSRQATVGKSGVLRVVLAKEMLPGLTIDAPEGYGLLRQRTIPLGSAYEPERPLSDPGVPFDVVWDSGIEREIRRQLLQIKKSKKVLSADRLKAQLQRKHARLVLPDAPRQAWSAAEIYERRKRSTLIVVSMMADGEVVTASGVVVNPSGVMATAYHVLNKPGAVARGAMTFDGAMHAIEEVLAADRPSDVALAKIDGESFMAVPLSDGDPEGAPVTILSHPGGEYYTLTRGVIGRYFTITQYGNSALQMSVTADFADGSSGGPIFNDVGAVTGIVSATRPIGNQMVSHFAAPAACIRALIEAPAE